MPALLLIDTVDDSSGTIRETKQAPWKQTCATGSSGSPPARRSWVARCGQEQPGEQGPFSFCETARRLLYVALAARRVVGRWIVSLGEAADREGCWIDACH